MDKSSAQESREVTRCSTPSKITDYFPSSSKSTKAKQCKTDTDTASLDTSGLSEEVLESSVLLTPEASPAKEEEDSIAKKDSDDPCISSTDVPSSKQVILENGKPNKTKLRKSKSQTDTSNTADVGTTKKGRGAKTKKKGGEPQLNNSLVTDYFPVRRSNRRCKTDIEALQHGQRFDEGELSAVDEKADSIAKCSDLLGTERPPLEKEKKMDLEDRVLKKKEEGLKVVEIENKGRGVVATKTFYRGDFVIEYAGDLIDLGTAKQKEKQYSENPETGCYMYYFTHKNKNYCVDATAESGRLGRLINHSRTGANCQTKLIDIQEQPYLILTASRDIKTGEELLYDYGDRSKTSIESHPWLKQ